MSALNISIVQADLHWQEPELNLAEFARVLQQMDQGSDLVVLPEMFATGFTMDADAHAERMNGRSVTWLAEMAGKTGAAICPSLDMEDLLKFRKRFPFHLDADAFSITPASQIEQ